MKNEKKGLILHLMKPTIIIQARSGSTRLPRKMLLPFYQGKSILEILVGRIMQAFADLKVIVATTINPADDEIVDLCKNIGCDCYRGSETDVLQRFIDAAEEFDAKRIVRICADNIFLDLDSMKLLIDDMEKNDYDYTSFCTQDNKPMILTHYGLWAMEGCSLEALKKAARISDAQSTHEHVTYFLYNNPEKFSLRMLKIDDEIQKEQRLRLTIDTKEDFDMMGALYKALKSENAQLSPRAIFEEIQNTPGCFEAMEKIINQNRKS